MEIKRKSTDRSAKCELFVGRPFPENNNKQREKAFLQAGKDEIENTPPAPFLKNLMQAIQSKPPAKGQLTMESPLETVGRSVEAVGRIAGKYPPSPADGYIKNRLLPTAPVHLREYSILL